MTSKKIDIIIVGAQKAGTTSLKNYLGQHKDICTHKSVECSFFGIEEEFYNDYNNNFNKYFSSYKNESIVLAKYAHLYGNEKMIKRLYEHNPDVKIIFILRNPVERAYSSYLMEKNSGWMKRPFNDIVDVIEKNKLGQYDVMYRLFIDLGIYVKHIQNLLKYFQQENIWIYLFEDFKDRPLEIVNDICKKAGISEMNNVEVKRHNGAYRNKSESLNLMIQLFKNERNYLKRTIKAVLPEAFYYSITKKISGINKEKIINPTIDAATYIYLYNYFEPYNKELESMMSLCLSNWNSMKQVKNK